MRNVFRAEELWEIVKRHGSALASVSMPSAARMLYRIGLRGREPSAREFNGASRKLAREALKLQELSRAYWTPFLRELRDWRAAGLLLREGAPVSSLLIR